MGNTTADLPSRRDIGGRRCLCISEYLRTLWVRDQESVDCAIHIGRPVLAVACKRSLLHRELHGCHTSGREPSRRLTFDRADRAPGIA
ncbi:hypothetical protein BD310DRAFT_834224 [Dichomitus squalens]|uniref:Uncharacterized protein n=1 Tax=Dichomitus squalens TaxID=114155 RepID=A0A4Q9P9Z7_9APHY|nr:hypothetical protein BD310DRAFT_834224 [Dichomitus squalens]